MIIKFTAKSTTVEHDGGQVHDFNKKHDGKSITAMMKSRLFSGKGEKG